MNASRGMIETRRRAPASIVIGSAPSVIAAIAPIQVGPCVRRARVGPPPVVLTQPRVGAVEQQQRSGRVDALLEQHVALLDLADRRRDRGPLRQLLVDQLVEQVQAAELVDERHLFGQVLVDQRDGHRALAHRARDALDRARADVAGDEHPRHAWSPAGRGRA